MPTNNKTSLGLNSWVGTDKPMRRDFVDDNTLLDTLLTSHFNNTDVHLTAADRTQLKEGFVIGTYSGNGAAKQEISLPFDARLVIVFLSLSVCNLYVPSGGYNKNSLAFATKQGNTMGINLGTAKLTVFQTQNTPSNGGTLNNFNCDGGQYEYIAFR